MATNPQIKKIYDPLYGFMSFTPLMIKIIDTPQFQRLSDLKQLGATSHVFPGANHTRKEHSLGVCHLATEMARAIQQNQPELNITPRLIELLGIAGLVHDIGHGPFSHLFDNYIVPNESHEERGCQIFKGLVGEYNLSLQTEEIEMITKMICPSPTDNWQYQIVANAVNQIDVDKIDYIRRDCYHIGLSPGGEYERIVHQARVIDEQICFPKKIYYDIYNLFATRYRLHKQVYQHPAVIGYEFLIIDILKEIMKTAPPFVCLTDSAVTCRLRQLAPESLRKMDLRQHWRCVEEKRLTYTEVSHPPLPPNDANTRYHIHTLGFVGRNKPNPLKNIYFYVQLDKKFRMDPQDYSFIIPEECRETILRIYKKFKN